MRRRGIIVASLILAPSLAFAQAPSPPSISQSTQDAITVNQLMSIIAERDRQYQQRFESMERAFNVQFVSAEKAVQSALIAAKEAVQKAEVASEKRFDSVNEFRNTLRDQQTTFMTRSEAEARFKDFDRRIVETSEQVSSRASEARGAAVLWGYILGGIGALVGLGGFAMAFSAVQARRRATAAVDVAA